MNITDLYHIADSEDIEILEYSLPNIKSMSLQTEDTCCYVGIDTHEIQTTAEYKTRLAHEIGHCIKGAFYNRHSDCDLISRHEYRADKWACDSLIPKEDMLCAMEKGYQEVWQLAEYFNVTEDLIRKACWIYFDKVV